MYLLAYASAGGRNGEGGDESCLAVALGAVNLDAWLVLAAWLPCACWNGGMYVGTELGGLNVEAWLSCAAFGCGMICWLWVAR